jgi:hypothetical protein
LKAAGTAARYQTRRGWKSSPAGDSFDVKWVMSQVDHADAKMTLDVYAQLQQRVDRSHGTAFDALVRRARSDRGDDEVSPV